LSYIGRAVNVASDFDVSLLDLHNILLFHLGAIPVRGITSLMLHLAAVYRMRNIAPHVTDGGLRQRVPPGETLYSISYLSRVEFGRERL